jgi:hypothetical protein
MCHVACVTKEAWCFIYKGQCVRVLIQHTHRIAKTCHRFTRDKEEAWCFVCKLRCVRRVHCVCVAKLQKQAISLTFPCITLLCGEISRPLQPSGTNSVAVVQHSKEVRTESFAVVVQSCDMR